MFKDLLYRKKKKATPLHYQNHSIKSHGPGAAVKVPLGHLHLVECLDSGPSPPTDPSFLLLHTLGSSWNAGCCHPHGKLRWSSWPLASSLPQLQLL